VTALYRYQDLRLGGRSNLLRYLDAVFHSRLAEMTTESLEAWKESAEQYLASQQCAAPMSSDALPFRDAVARFQAFLFDQGWPTAIVWVPTWTIDRRPGPSTAIESIHAGHEAHAANEYHATRDRGLGVCLDAVCTIGDTTYATVLWPADARAAELLMYPSDGGLKLSVAVPRTEGRIRAGGG
jgi:hypothetical protein